MKELPIVAHDLNQADFPFTIEWISGVTGEVVKTQVVDGPGVLEVNAMPEHKPVTIRMTYPDGTVMTSD